MFLLFAVVAIDILALIIIILFVIGPRNCPDAPAVSDEKEIHPPADVPPPDPQPDEQAVVDAPPQNLWPICVGVDAILSAFDEEIRNQEEYILFKSRDEGVDFKAEIIMGGRGCQWIFGSIQDIGTVFPKVKVISFNGCAINNIALNDFGHQKFRELERISVYGNTIPGPCSLTLTGTFDSLKSISFMNCYATNAIVFSGEDLTAIKNFSISSCYRLVDVTGIWDGENPLLDRNSFKKLTINSAPYVNIANLNTWLIPCATKCDLRQGFTCFYCQNNGSEIQVYANRKDLKLGDLNALANMLITTAHFSSMTDIPFRKNTQQTWNINVRSSSRYSTVVLKFEGPGNVANAEGVFPRNVTATDEINTENISNFQMKITYDDPVKKITFNNAPWEPVSLSLTKKNPLFTVEFANLNAVPGELLLKETASTEGAENAVPPRAPNAAGEVIAYPAPEPHGLNVILDGNSEAVGLWRKGGVDHYLAVGKSRDISGLKHAGWQEVRKEEITGFGEGILFRRANILPAPAP